MNCTDSQEVKVEQNECMIESELSSEGLKIYLHQKQSQNAHTLTCQIPSLSVDHNIESTFENLEHLNEHLVKDKSFRIDRQRRILIILLKVGTKKGKFIQIAQLPLQIVRVDYQADLRKIANKFSYPRSVTSSDTSLAIQKIAHILTLFLDTRGANKNTQSYHPFSQSKIVAKPSKQKVADGSTGSVQKNYESLKLQIDSINKKIRQISSQQERQLQKLNRICQEQHHKLREDILKMVQNIQILTTKTLQAPKYYQNLLNSLERLEWLEGEKFQLPLTQEIVNPIDMSSNMIEEKKQSNSNHGVASSLLDEWLDDESKSTNSKVRIKNSTIHTETSCAKLFSKVKIAHTYSFTVKIKEIYNYIIVGAIDSSYKKRNNYKLGILNNYLAYSTKGNCYDGKGEYRVQEVKEGEKVTTVVDRQIGKIEWRRGEELLYKVQHVNLRNQTVEWVPFIYLSRDCCVSLKASKNKVQADKKEPQT